MLCYHLFEKDFLRKDIINLCDVLVANNCYVTAVNTKKLDTENIEIAKGISEHILKDLIMEETFQAIKLVLKVFTEIMVIKNLISCFFLMIVSFIQKKDLDEWIKEFISSEIPVTGTTENFEVEHHIGSFTLAVMKSV